MKSRGQISIKTLVVKYLKIVFQHSALRKVPTVVVFSVSPWSTVWVFSTKKYVVSTAGGSADSFAQMKVWCQACTLSGNDKSKPKFPLSINQLGWLMQACVMWSSLTSCHTVSEPLIYLSLRFCSYLGSKFLNLKNKLNQLYCHVCDTVIYPQAVCVPERDGEQVTHTWL